jgi:hypothetical protein
MHAIYKYLENNDTPFKKVAFPLISLQFSSMCGGKETRPFKLN